MDRAANAIYSAGPTFHLQIKSLRFRGGRRIARRDPWNGRGSHSKGWPYVTNTTTFMRRALRGGTALQALALMGAGLGAIAFAAPAAAQDYSQVNATGRVQGTNGEPIAGATVTVRSNAQGDTRTATTNDNGVYRVPALQQGTYTFTIEASGFDTITDPAVTLTQAGAGNQFTLAPTGGAAGAGGDEIVVTAGRVQVADFDRTTVGTVIPLGELATRVPVARDISSVVQLSPGTTAGDSAFGNLPNIAGSSVAENVFYVNGLNITNFRTGLGAVAIPFDFYNTVEVKNGGFSAEFGRTTGGVVNATTKSGSNEFHGGILFSWEPDSLRQDTPNTLFADNDAREFDRFDTVAQLSGPIIKDRLFFYAIYNSREVTTKQATTAIANNDLSAPVLGTGYIIDRSDSPFYGFKVDAIITDGHRLEGTFFDSRSAQIRSTYGNAAQASAANARLGGRRYNPITNDPGTLASTQVFRSGGVNYVGRYTGVFTDWLTLSAAYGVNKDRDTSQSSNPDLPSVVDQRGGTSISIGNAAANEDTNADEREFYRADVDLYFNLLGSHHVRGGYDRENLTTNIVTRSNGIGQVTLINGSANDPAGITTGQYAQIRIFQNGGEFTSRNEAYYIQDSWSLFDNRLNLNLGIRNDRFTNRNIAGVPFYESGDQWGPRLGFTGDPFGDGRTKVYGNFGRYFFPVAANTNNRLGGAELDYNQYFRFSGLDANNVPILTTQLAPAEGQPCLEGRPGTCVVNSDGVPIAAEAGISQNLKSQSLDEYIIGIERRIGQRFRVNLFATWRDLNEALDDTAIDRVVRNFCNANNLNGPNPDGPDPTRPFEGGTTCQSIFTGTHQYVLFNPGSSITTVLSDPINGESTPRTVSFTADELGFPKAVRRYRAVTVQAIREFDGKWGGEVSYTWSSTKGNTEGGIRSDNAQADLGATSDFDLIGLADGTFGFSPNHRRHNIKAYGSYAFADWLTVGINAQIQSPRKYGCLGTVPPSRDPDAAAQYGAVGTYCNVNSDGSVRTTPAAAGETLPARQIVQRGTAFESEWLYVLNLDASIRIPTDAFDGTLRVSVFNVLNTKQKIDFQETGTLFSGAPRLDYGQVNLYQAPRSARIQFGVNF